MSYLLDTNVIIAILKNDPESVRDRLRHALSAGALVAVSAVAMYELWYGAAKSTRHAENAQRLRVFLSGGVNVWPFDDEDAVRAGEIRAELEARGTPIGPYDVLIAAQAYRRGATLVTANEKEFGRVHGLAWENWATRVRGRRARRRTKT